MIYNRIIFFKSIKGSTYQTIKNAVYTNITFLKVLEDYKDNNYNTFKLKDLENKILSIQHSDPMLKHNCEKLLGEIIASENKQTKSDKDFSFVYKLILNYLAGLNNSNDIKAETDKEIKDNKFGYNDRNMPQVFLSFAYDDNLFTYALFRYFYDNGIYLYVDWMHNGPINDGNTLKSILSREIIKSEQFLFLLSPNSEFSLKSNPYIRPWCAWEYGHFLGSKKENQNVFVFNLFSQNLEKINMLHGFYIFADIKGQKIIGNETVKNEDTSNKGVA